MSSAIAEARSLFAVEPLQHFVFHNIDWPTYRTISDALPERHLRMTYDGRNLEVMSISRLHGRLSRLIARMMHVLSEEMEIPISACGDFTLNRNDVERALEPDECFYIQHEAEVRDREKIDLSIDPPPDLAIEIDVSRSSLDRLTIYAKLGVPEVWRWRDGEIVCYLLDKSRGFQIAATSQAFPNVTPADLSPFVVRALEMDNITLTREFQAWVRDRIAANWEHPAT